MIRSNFQLRSPLYRRVRQRGAVLMVSLMVLLMLTMLTLTAIRASTMQEKIAGSTRNIDLALQAAEAALRVGETSLSGNTLPDYHATAGWYHYVDKPAPSLMAPGTAWNSGVISMPLVADDGWQVSQAPRYIVEALPPIPEPGGDLEAGGVQPDTTMYRVTAIGFSAVPFGDIDDAQYSVILQTTYRR